MASEWHYTKGDQQIGPVSAAELKSLVQSGDLSPDDQVWKEGMAEWKRAKSLKGLFPPVPETAPKTQPPPLPQSSEPVQAETSAGDFDWLADAKKPTKSASAMSSFVSTAKSAGQFAAKQAEKTKLTTLTLPALYRTLGKHCYESQQFRDDFPDLFQRLDAVQNELANLAARRNEQPTSPQSFGDKAKATANRALQAAQSKKLSMQQSSLLSSLGKAVHDKHQDASGPEEIATPIRDALVRLQTLDSEIAAVSKGISGRIGKAGPGWMQNPWIIGLSLVVFFPFGLYLVWVHPGWPAKTKWSWTGAFAAFVFLVGVANSGKQDGKNATANVQKDVESGGNGGNAAANTDQIPQWMKGLNYDQVIQRLGRPNEEIRSSKPPHNMGLAIWQIADDDYTVVFFIRTIDGSGDSLVLSAREHRTIDFVESIKRSFNTLEK